MMEQKVHRNSLDQTDIKEVRTVSSPKDNSAESTFTSLSMIILVNQERGSFGGFCPYMRLHWILFPYDKAVLMFSETPVSQIFVSPYVSSQETEKDS